MRSDLIESSYGQTCEGLPLEYFRVTKAFGAVESKFNTINYEQHNLTGNGPQMLDLMMA